MSKRLILIRHCTTAWNRISKVQGITDIDIDEGGREEAREFAELLRPVGIEIFYSSDLKRAVSTGKILSDILGVELVVDSRLRECNFGSIEGMLHNDVISQYGRDIFAGRNGANDFSFKAFGGESGDDVLGRQVELLDEIKLDTDENIALIGHGRSLNALLRHLDPESSKKHLMRGEYRIVRY